MRNVNMPWLDRKQYPFTSRFMKINNQLLHYIDEGEGDVILFVHGTPSWSFDFRKLIQSLKPNYRCIAPDHIGFGLSDKPAYHDYSTPNHARTLEHFIDYLRLQDITLVVHDFGGPIGFQYALRHPGNIRSVVVLNSWLWDFSDDKGFKSFKKIINGPLTPFLYKNLNFSARFLLPNSFGKTKLNGRLLGHYTRPFSNSSERNGPLAFARSLVNDQQWFQSLWEERHKLRDKPFLFIWGLKDKFVKPHFLDKFSSGFANKAIRTLDDCGHFPQEECANEVVKSIQKFLLPGIKLPQKTCKREA